MSKDRSLIFWTGLMAVTFVTTSRPLPADNQPASTDGYKIVPVTVGGRTIPLRVKDTSDPYRNVSSSDTSGKYDPERIFNASSSMANKQFALPSNSASKNDSGLKNQDQNTFVTKAYADDASPPLASNLHSKASLPTAGAYSRSADEFSKSYPTSSVDAEDSRPAAALPPSLTTADQNRSAALGGPEKQEVLASNSMANKQYLGPGAQHVPDGIVIKKNVILSRVSDLPNRALSIDEVRDLINHGFKPDTGAKPPEPSKPLNDPNYKPEPLRDTPAPDSDDDKNDPVPPPGTMAMPQPPENSEPLPQP